MSDIQGEKYEKARQGIEKLRLEKSELMDQILAFTGLAGQMHRQRARIQQVKSKLIRAAEALENSPSETHIQLIQELRKAGQ